jgi:hypothetical protein
MLNPLSGARMTEKLKHHVRGAFVLAAALQFAGCGGGYSHPTPTAAITVTVGPPTSSVQVSQTQTFTATVNNTTNKAVTWTLSGPGCTGATCGTLDNASSNPVTYTAPVTIPSPATVTLTGTSAADATKFEIATITVTVAPAITVTLTPKLSAVVVTTQKQQFTAQVANDPNSLGVTWSVDSIAGGNVTVGTITAAGLYTPPASAGTHSITATSVGDSSKSAAANIAVTDLAGVFTHHNNLARDGTNTQEYALTTSTVSKATFGKLFSCPVDGVTYTQPLWVPGVTISGAVHNVIFVATQHDSLYAFDADSNPCVQLWHVNLIASTHGGTAGETSVPTGSVGSGFQDIQPEIGVTSTPVIDPATGTIYVLSKSVNASTTFFQRLHALAMTTGAEKFSGPADLSASVPGTGDGGSTVSFDLQNQHQRSALALVNVNGSDVVYVSSASHEDKTPYHGWVLGYNAANVTQQVAVFNSTANSGLGGIWMAGSAPAADSSGNLFLATGNGQFDGNLSAPPNNDFGDSVLKLDATTGLTLTDWFTPDDQLNLENQDADLGSGGVTLLPDQPLGPHDHLLVAAGKESIVYLIDRDGMGNYRSNNNGQIVQSFSAGNGSFGTPAFWQNNLYYAGAGGSLQLFEFDPVMGKFITSPSSQSSHSFSFPGATASISSQGASNGIAWAMDVSQYGVPSSFGLGPAVLYAYDATDLTTELWDSTQATSNRDQACDAVKFVPPTVANGKVYVSTRTEVDVYGLLPN